MPQLEPFDLSWASQSQQAKSSIFLILRRSAIGISLNAWLYDRFVRNSTGFELKTKTTFVLFQIHLIKNFASIYEFKFLIKFQNFWPKSSFDSAKIWVQFWLKKPAKPAFVFSLVKHFYPSVSLLFWGN